MERQKTGEDRESEGIQKKGDIKAEKQTNSDREELMGFGDERSAGSVYLKVLYLPHINITELPLCNVGDILSTNNQPFLLNPASQPTSALN